MTVNKISRDFSRTVFIDIPSKRGSITVKAGIEASVTENEDIDTALMALQMIAEKEVEKTLAMKLKELGVSK